MVITER